MKRLLGALAVAVGTACGDQTATQYVGTVMNEASPEAEGTLTLTLFSRTDTSFSGVIELGLPAVGTGSAYAWHEGSELRIVSVAATGGDTILWTSKLTDEGLGGRYEVTGGKRRGQGGTWRAHLTKGPPATPATLRLPQAIALPPASAMWPLVLLFLAVAWLARWIRRAPQPVVGEAAAADSAQTSGPSKPKLSGISGWLAFFVIGQVLGLIVTLARLGAIREYADSIGVGAAVTGMQPLVVFELASQILAPLVALAGIILIVRRSRYAPRYWFGYLTFSAIVLAVDLLLAAYMSSELQRLIGAAYMEATAKDDDSGEMFRQLVMSIVWALYWVRSERVRATFGAAALDRRADTTPAASVGEAPAVSPSPATDVTESPAR